MNYQTELAKEYYQISKKLNDPNVSEKYLDDLLEVFTHQLSSLEESKGNEKKLLRNLKKVQDNKKLNQPIIMTEEQEINGALDKLYAMYESEKKDLSYKEVTRIVKSLEPYIKKIEDLDLDHLDIEDDFRDFLGNIIARLTNKPGAKTKTIKNKERKAAYKSLVPTHERLSSYFNDDNIKVKTKKVIDKEYNCYYESNLLLALKNYGICEQSDLNRIKSLGTGTLLTESIKAVVPKRKHNQVRELHKIQEARYKEYLDARDRLIK